MNDSDVQTLNMWCSELPNAIIEALPDDSVRVSFPDGMKQECMGNASPLVFVNLVGSVWQDVQRFLRTLVKVLDRITQNRHVVRYTVTLLLRILRGAFQSLLCNFISPFLLSVSLPVAASLDHTRPASG